MTLGNTFSDMKISICVSDDKDNTEKRVLVSVIENAYNNRIAIIDFRTFFIGFIFAKGQNLTGFVLIYYFACSTCNPHSLRVFFYERLDMADALAFENLVNRNEDACLLHITKAVVDGCSEELHRWAEVHVGINQWWDVEAQGTDASVKDSVVLLEISSAEHL